MAKKNNPTSNPGDNLTPEQKHKSYKEAISRMKGQGIVSGKTAAELKDNVDKLKGKKK